MMSFDLFIGFNEVSRVSDQNGVSQLYHCGDTPFWAETLGLFVYILLCSSTFGFVSSQPFTAECIPVFWQQSPVQELELLWAFFPVPCLLELSCCTHTGLAVLLGLSPLQLTLSTNATAQLHKLSMLHSTLLQCLSIQSGI